MVLYLSSPQVSSFQQTWIVIWEVNREAEKLLSLGKETTKNEWKHDLNDMDWNQGKEQVVGALEVRWACLKQGSKLGENWD